MTRKEVNRDSRIYVRLSDEEMDMLKRVPGVTIADKFRYLLFGYDRQHREGYHGKTGR